MNGIIAWFARNDVAANLLMVLIAILGISAAASRITMEMFPSTEPDVINVVVTYPGASPAEVETGVVLKVEEAISDLQGIEYLYANAYEGVAQIRVEVEDNTDPRELMNDITSRLNRVRNLPEEAEEPSISLLTRLEESLSVVLSGTLDEFQMRQLGEQIRDEIIAEPNITQAELTGMRPREISIEVSETTLRQYRLTLSQVAQAIRRSSIDVPAGAIKTTGGEILLRSVGQSYTGAEFSEIVVITQEDGSRITVADIATVSDSFSEEPLFAKFDGQVSAVIEVYRTGDQNVVDVAETTIAYIARRAPTLPDGVVLTYWRDRSKYVKARLNTLVKSAIQGGILIFIMLTLFLRLSVAIWVSIGIPISFMGALALMPEMGVTFNLASLFAFILVLGIVVDDAIVTGENIYRRMKFTKDSEEAAIVGTQEIATPVTFGVLTTVAAFIPLLMIEGRRGNMFANMAMVVIPVMLFSLVESKLILPAHMKHVRSRQDERKPNIFQRFQQAIANGLETGVERYYKPVLEKTLDHRYLTASLFLAACILMLSFTLSGRYTFIFFPRIPSEIARVTLTMPVGTPAEITAQHLDKMFQEAKKLQDKHREPNDDLIIQHILTRMGHTSRSSSDAAGKSNIGQVSFRVIPPEERTTDIDTRELVREWRKNIGQIPGAEEVQYRAELGRGGDPIDIQLSGIHFSQLAEISEKIKERLKQYPGLFDIKDSFENGKEEIRLSIKPEAEILGLSQTELGRQVRDAFYGQEAQRIQRERDEIKVMVRYPKEQRESLESLRDMSIRTAGGDEVPFSAVANMEMGRSFAVIKRVDRIRTINVTADLNKATTDAQEIIRDLRVYMPEVLANYPGVKFAFEGEQKEQKETFGSLAYGVTLTLFAVYALLAIPFKSYIQPLIVMVIIPFSFIGAILGHMIMGYALSITSLLGMLALIGVVVNDSLVLVDYINRRRREGMSIDDAVRIAGVHRFRPILLTSLTTFVGLVPLMWDKSTQAQFLIPMGISLGYGILFATFLTLILVPSTYIILEDIKKLLGIRPTIQVEKSAA